MPSISALWTTPRDIPGFNRHYAEVHLPIVKAWPGLQELTVTRFTALLPEGVAPWHLILQAWFATGSDRDRVLGEHIAAAAEDAAGMETRYGAQVQVLLSEHAGAEDLIKEAKGE